MRKRHLFANYKVNRFMSLIRVTVKFFLLNANLYKSQHLIHTIFNLRGEKFEKKAEMFFKLWLMIMIVV